MEHSRHSKIEVSSWAMNSTLRVCLSLRCAQTEGRGDGKLRDAERPPPLREPYRCWGLIRRSYRWGSALVILPRSASGCLRSPRLCRLPSPLLPWEGAGVSESPGGAWSCPREGKGSATGLRPNISPPRPAQPRAWNRAESEPWVGTSQVLLGSNSARSVLVNKM